MVQCLRPISFLFALYEWPQELLADASCCIHEEQGDLMGKPVMALEPVMEWNVGKWWNIALGLFHCSDLFNLKDIAVICLIKSVSFSPAVHAGKDAPYNSKLRSKHQHGAGGCDCYQELVSMILCFISPLEHLSNGEKKAF